MLSPLESAEEFLRNRDFSCSFESWLFPPKVASILATWQGKKLRQNRRIYLPGGTWTYSVMKMGNNPNNSLLLGF